MAAADPTPDDIAYLAAIVRAHDRPRYYATLFAPAAVRPDLFALYGFAAEVARIPDLVSEPTLGEIRLKWWQESLGAAAFAPQTGDSPAVRALAATIARRSLPLAPFEALIAAHAADLYADPPDGMADVEGRLGETQSALFQLAAIVCGASGPDAAEAAGHAGVAYGLARRLSRFAEDRARGRTFLPAHLLAREKLTAADLFAAAPRPALTGVIATMGRHAESHLGSARWRLAEAPSAAQGVFLPLAVVEPLLARIARMGDDILVRPVRMSDLETLSRIAWARMRGAGRQPARRA